MSINSTILDEHQKPLPLNSLEKFLFETDDILEFSYICGNGYPGSTLGYASQSGKLLISDLRIIFLSVPEFPVFKSFSCQFNKISNVSLQKVSIFSITRTILTLKITSVSDSLNDFTIKFKSPNTAKSVETLINLNVESFFDPPPPPPPPSFPSFPSLPLYSPPIPTYEEVTTVTRRTSSNTNK